MTTLTASASTPAARPSKALNVSLWVVQVLLALAFGMAGLTKATSPMADLAAPMPWTVEFGAAMTRFIGVSELLGAVGLLLPALLRVMPSLTALAGASLTLVMVLAAGLHAMRGEYPGLAICVVFGALTAFVAWGRFRKAPIAPRG